MFRKGLFANQAVQQSRIVRAVSSANADIFFAPNTVLETLFILTTKRIEIVHDGFLLLQVPTGKTLVTQTNIIVHSGNAVNTNRAQGKIPKLAKKWKIVFRRRHSAR
jgi:hypothetical protein